MTRSASRIRIVALLTWALLTGAVGCGGIGEPGPEGPAGPAGPTGPTGDPGKAPGPGTARVTGVLPTQGHLDRSLLLTISVQGLVVDAKTTVDFGSGVTVDEVAPLHETALRAKVSIAAQAAVGPRTVTVKSAAGEVIGKEIFQVSAPLFATVTGDLVQGGLVLAEVVNLDGFLFNPDPQAFRLMGTGLLGLTPILLNETHAAYVSIIAPRAPLAPAQLQAANLWMLEPTRTFLSEPGIFTPAARAPVTVTTSLGGQLLAKSNATLTYKFQASAFSGFFQMSSVPAKGSTASPVGWFFGDSGDYDSYLGSAVGSIPVPVVTSSPTFYAVVADRYFQGGAGFTFDMSSAQITAGVLSEQTTAHDTIATAQGLTGCVAAGLLKPCLVTGRYAKDYEVDVYSVKGLTAATKLMVTVRSAVPVGVWVQDPKLTVVNANAALTQNPLVGPGPQITGYHQLAFGATNDTGTAWTVVVMGATAKTGDYVLGILPVP